MMKRWLCWLLSLTLILPMTGCRNDNASPPPVRPQDLPELTVSILEVSVQATRGTCSWSPRQGAVTAPCIQVDALHVLDSKDYLTPLQLSAEDAYTAQLRFDIPPDMVQVKRWDESCWNTPDAPSETIQVQRSADNSAEASLWQLDLQRGNYIYEVYARWTTHPEYSGSAWFGFYTLQP